MNKREIKSTARTIIQLAQLESWYPHESMDSMDDNKLESIYIGSVLSIYPSGKYYTPFACSNVEPCARCKGSGHSKKTEPCTCCKGSGARSVMDICVIRYQTAMIDTREYSQVWSELHSVPDIKWIDPNTFKCNQCNGSGFTQPECTYCNGIGSREAYEDSLMSDYLESFAQDLNQWIESGDGDPLDIFLVRTIDTESPDGKS